MTKTKLTVAAMVLVVVPTLSFAECSYGNLKEANLSCAEGTVWDAESQACVPSTS